MPQIPRFTPQLVPQDNANVGAASAIGLSLARSGERIRQAGEHLGAVEDAMQRAARAVKSAELESLINNGLDDYAETYQNRTDFEAFDTDAENQVEEIRRQYSKEVGDDKQLQDAVDLAFENKSSDFLRAIRAKKSAVVTNRGRGVLAGIVNDELDRYASAFSPEERKASRDTVAAKAAAFAESNIISFTEAERYVQDFDDVADGVRADRWIEADPVAALEALKGDSFDELSPKIKQSKIEKAENAVETQEREARLEDNRETKALEKARKVIVEKNDIDMWQAFYAGTLKETDLDLLAGNQMVSEATYTKIKDRLIKGEAVTENDPVAVAKIAARIELRDFKGAFERLEEAQTTGQVKGETYISLTRLIASKSFSDAIGYINKAMQPSDLEIDFFKRQKHADAVADFSTRVASGENPMEAAKDIVKLNKTTQAASLYRYRNPRYLKGDKTNVVNLAEAEFETVEAFKRDEITGPEYNAEIELIENIKKAIAQRDNTQSAEEDLDKAMKDLKVGK